MLTVPSFPADYTAITKAKMESVDPASYEAEVEPGCVHAPEIDSLSAQKAKAEELLRKLA